MLERLSCEWLFSVVETDEVEATAETLVSIWLVPRMDLKSIGTARRNTTTPPRHEETHFDAVKGLRSGTCFLLELSDCKPVLVHYENSSSSRLNGRPRSKV
jgi:hypothetical protein